jgi:hypothetical protein
MSSRKQKQKFPVDSTGGLSRGHQLRSKLGVHFDETLPVWKELPVINDCLLLSYEFPSSIEDIIAGVQLKQKQPVRNQRKS